MMAHDSASPLRRNWQLFETALLLRKALRTERCSQQEKSNLQKAIVENNFSEVCALLEGEERHQVNRTRAFITDGCKVCVSLLCVAVCHQNLPIIHCLLQHGANPNQLGRISVVRQGTDSVTVFRVSPLMMATEDHPSEGLPFDTAVASALLKAGANVNSTKGCVIHVEEEEGGSIIYKAPDTLLLRSVDVYRPHSPAVFFFLLNNGANLFIRDTNNNFTPLQKALHWLTQHPDDKNPQICVEELILRGGFGSSSSSPPSGLPKTEFSFLLKAMTKAVLNNKDTRVIQRIAHLLLDAGYQCSVGDIACLKTLEVRKVDPCLADKACGVHIYSLKHQCRVKIRKSVQHWHCLDKLTGLPESVIDYLKFR